MTELNTMKPRLSPSLSYLILVQPMLVAVDIGQAIADFVPNAKVIIVQSATEASDALKMVENIHVAFLGLAPGSDNGWRIAEAVRARGGRLVFIGDEAEDQGSGPYGVVLERPFDTDAVCSAIKGLPQTRSVSANQLIGMAYTLTRHHGAPVKTSPFAHDARGQSPVGNRLDGMSRT